jgi:CheY-like chemotaxis protein
VILALVEDLMFLSRINQVAQSHGLAVTTARTPEQLTAAALAGPRLVLIDLDRQRLPIAATVAQLRAAASGRELPIVGFFSHVHAERGQEAQAAGCTSVLPRSMFVRELPSLAATAAATDR